MNSGFSFKHLSLIGFGIAALILTGCPDDGADGDDADEQGEAANTAVPSCGDLITKAQLDALLEAKSTWDDAANPLCMFKAGEGSGNIQAFGDGETSYEQMEAGAIEAFGEDKINTTDSIGAASYEYEGKDILGIAQTVQIGFLDSTSRFAVLISIGEPLGDLTLVRDIAKTINTNLQRY